MRKFLLITLKFGIPFTLWVYFFQFPIFNRIPVGSETFTVYSVIKFLTDNLGQGVFPLWNPFVLRGEPSQIHVNYIGAFNPVWLLIIALFYVKVSPYAAFLFVTFIYYFTGMIGFYLLAKAILKNSLCAYAAFLSFLFSSFSLSLFAQFHPALIYIPSIWFFYFLVRFLQDYKKLHFIGLCFSLMLIMTSYLPFYFITVLVFVAVPWVILYLKEVIPCFLKKISFIRDHFLLVTICSACLAAAAVPGVNSYVSTIKREVVNPVRQGLTTIYDKGVKLPYEHTTRSSLTSRMSFEDLFSNLDIYWNRDDGKVYVSVFVYLLVLLGAFSAINRRIILFLVVFILIFFLMMTNATPFHRFLFEHVFYFKLIRNMQFLAPFLLSSIILLAAELLRSFMEDPRKFFINRGVGTGLIVLLHALAGWFLYKQGDPLLSSFVTIGLSAVFCLWVLWRPHENGKALLYIFLFLCVLLQPMEVFWYQTHLNEDLKAKHTMPRVACPPDCPRATPQFSYTRPYVPRKNETPVMIGHYNSTSRILMTDSSGFYPVSFPTYWMYYLSQNIDEDVFEQFLTHKILLYDRIELISQGKEPFDRINQSLRELTNLAFVSQEGADLSALVSARFAQDQARMSQAQVMDGPTEQFMVEHFDVNSLRFVTDFKEDKLLVYTDSYHPLWEGRRNGKPIPIYQANVAFKGIYLPAGRNEVELHYHPLFGMATYFLILGMFVVFFIWLVFAGLKEMSLEGTRNP